MKTLLATRNSPPRHRQIIGALVVLILSVSARRTPADAIFDAQLDLEFRVLSPVITNKFGFATSFPKPAAPGLSNPNGNAGTPDLGPGQPDLTPAGGGVRVFTPNPPLAQRKNVPAGRGFALQAGGRTAAPAVLGAIAGAEAYAAGKTRIRLGNFTGRPGLPPAEDLTIDLGVFHQRGLTAIAEPDADSYDWAYARYNFEVTDEAGDKIGALSMPMERFAEAEESNNLGIPRAAGPAKTHSITLKPNTFVNLDLYGQVYTAGFSLGIAPAAPPVIPPAALAPLKTHVQPKYPTPDIQIAALPNALFGDAIGHGNWLLADVAGVTGNDPQARFGHDTVFLTQIANDPNQHHDLEIAVEAPIDGQTIVTLDNSVVTAGGVHAFNYQMELGTGVGEQFQLVDQPEELAFLGPESGLIPQEQTGLQLADLNDPFAPTALFFEGELLPGQQAQFLTQVAVHDGIDGVMDGLARFTLRHATEGFGGDYNGDFVVDEQDYQLFKELFGTHDFLADGNGNGVVDAGDFPRFQDNRLPAGILAHGLAAAGSASATAVPEPSGATLCGLLACCLAAGSRCCQVGCCQVASTRDQCR